MDASACPPSLAWMPVGGKRQGSDESLRLCATSMDRRVKTLNPPKRMKILGRTTAKLLDILSKARGV